jgi:hypothetical protein
MMSPASTSLEAATATRHNEARRTDRRVSPHQFERIGEEFRAAEIAGLQRQQHFAMFRANGAQHRDAGGDFGADQKAGNPQAIDHRAGGFAAGGPNVW